MIQDRSSDEQLFASKGEMAMLMRSHDWSQTSLGAVENWPQSLRSTLSICLNSRFPIAIYWGADYLLLYNDAWRPIVGDKHPWALGRPGREVWSEIWDDIGPELAGVLATGEGTFHNDELLSMHRFGYTEECFFEYTFNPIQGEGGVVEGVFNVVSETTYRVLNERRARLLRESVAKIGTAKTVEEVCNLMVEAFKSDPFDIPFALLYLVDQDGKHAQLAGSTKLIQDSPVSPAVIDLTAAEADLWSIALAVRTTQPQVINDLIPRFGELPGSPWSEPPQEAMVLPIAAPGQSKVTGVLVAVASPRRKLDDNYRDFFDQIAGQIATAIANAQAYAAERKRAEALAELDRAKTAFFSNVSHEFRTPLTLLLSPIEELANTLGDRLQPDEREQLQLMQRNGLRLQKLVNTLLDFSRIEAERVQASYEPTDLAAYTADLASVFRSLIERAGMSLVIDCSPLPEPVYIDRDMWEKIVLNLMSNAFKFTFEGTITIRLQAVGNSVELKVTDTGVGIPEAELPRLFERFHRVSGMRSRTYEGSGIGLALVQELVKLHGGTIHVISQVDRGTTFAIAIPFGTTHLPQDRIQATRTLTSTALGANPYVAEASRWISEEGNGVWGVGYGEETSPTPHTLHPTPSARILLADDNADMRDYVRRLLNQSWEVETVSDGLAALETIAQRPPDLVLSDVMMPRLDGFGLLHELRANPATQNIPVILLSARAGEDARIEGLAAGADDYLTKPFSARELLARVEATLKLAQIRKQAETAIRQGEERLKLAVEAGRMIAWEWNPLENTLISTGLSEIYGIPSIQSAEQRFTLVHPEDRTQHQMTVENAVATKSNYHSEFRFIRPDNGAIVWLEERGNVILNNDGSLQKLIGTTIDITNRKQAEDQLLESEKFLKAINETAPNLLYIFDLNERRNVYVSPQISPMLGILPADVQRLDSQIFVQLFHPDDLEHIQQHHDRMRAAQEDHVFTIEYRMKHSSGRWLWLSSRDTIFVRDEQGKPTQILGSAIDITDRKIAEQQREQLLAREQTAREAAETANRIKDEFLAVLSHELRSPLNPILGWSKLLRNGKLDATRTSHALETIERNAQLQVQLIDDLLDISRILRGKLILTVMPVDLSTIISAALETVRLAAEAKAIQIQTTALPGIGMVMGDAGRLQQVVWNLLSNAIKFTPSNGQITVELSLSGNTTQIQVSDTGKGIKSDFLPYVFEHFRQEDGATTRKFGGLGLGLAIVRQIVELHGGTVSVDSPGEGQGTTFIVQIPLALHSHVLPAIKQPSSSTGDLSGFHVLVVDDDADSREFVAFVLEQVGANVTHVASGIEALQTIEKSSFDLIVSDIGMPDMDGYMLLQQIRRLETARHIPAIALTAYAGELDQQQALQSGFQKHLSKPVVPENLVSAIVTLM